MRPSSAVKAALPTTGALVAVLAAALLVPPLAARGSGAVLVPVAPKAAVDRASVIVLGRSLGARDVPVEVPIGETGLSPRGRTVLAFSVRQIGVRVEAVIGRDPRKLVKPGAELWLTDPASYDRGMMGELAEVAWVAQERYAYHRYVEADRPGTRLIAFAETAADRAARGKRTVGLADAWWQVAAHAFETPARRAQVERLRRAPRVPEGRPGPR